jgi:hypothetical protein
MATAKRTGGLYYIGDKAVDSEGKEIAGAPPKPADTQPSAPGQPQGGDSNAKLAAAIDKLAEAVATSDDEPDAATPAPPKEPDKPTKKA